jgi:hypothetical protein
MLSLRRLNFTSPPSGTLLATQLEGPQMSQEERLQRRAEAAAEFDRHENRNDGARVANSLADGLTVLRDLCYHRVHYDVERAFGLDSMLLPVSLMKSEAKAKAEIDLYQIVESCLTARERHYFAAADDWSLRWLAQLLLGAGAEAPTMLERLTQYAVRPEDERRRSFSQLLERAFPEASRAPLIVYRLLPLAVGIVTAIAFADHAAAAELRNRQKTLLPGISDCNQCRGGVLENGEKCQHCGNPFWKYNWLTAD